MAIDRCVITFAKPIGIAQMVLLALIHSVSSPLRAAYNLVRGVALVHSKGHTEGNHSLVARVRDGIRVTSENGIGADAYEPKKLTY
jgi:hypothetical protein